MIDAIKLYNLRNADFIQFNKDFTIIVNRNNPTTLLVLPQYTALLGKITEMEALFQTATANPMTAELEALDLRRDRALNGLLGQIKSFCNHYEPAMAQAAMVLQSNINLYGSGISEQNYQRETAIINNLVTDWQTKTELRNAIDMLGIFEWTIELKTINEEFGQKYIDRTQDYGSASPENLKIKRAETMTAYYDLRKRLEARAEVEGTPIYTTTMNELNALIEQYNATLRGRTTVTEEVVNPSPN